MKTSIDLLEQAKEKDKRIVELQEKVDELTEKNEKLEAIVNYITVMTGVDM